MGGTPSILSAATIAAPDAPLVLGAARQANA